MEPIEHPAKKIKFLLRSYHTTVQELSEKIGITLESLRDILDEREMPTPNVLYRICDLFNVKENFFEVLTPAPGKAPPRDPGKEPEGLDDLFSPAAIRQVRAGEAGPARPGAPGKPSAARPGIGRPAPGGTGPGGSLQERRAGKLARSRHRRKLDLTELAARQQVLIDLLLSKNVFTKDEFDTRMEILRAKIIARARGVEKTR